MAGPGAIMVGLAIGSGELVLWPWITAKFGAQMMWAAAVGVCLQMWLNIEIGRWAIATGSLMATSLEISKGWRSAIATDLCLGSCWETRLGWPTGSRSATPCCHSTRGTRPSHSAALSRRQAHRFRRSLRLLHRTLLPRAHRSRRSSAWGSTAGPRGSRWPHIAGEPRSRRRSGWRSCRCMMILQMRRGRRR